jgi:hypothetical protein
MRCALPRAPRARAVARAGRARSCWSALRGGLACWARAVARAGGARRCWSALKGGLSADEIAAAHDVLLERMDAEFETLKRLEAVSSAAEATFAGAASAKDMDPAATADARAAETEAAENAQARARRVFVLYPLELHSPVMCLAKFSTRRIGCSGRAPASVGKGSLQPRPSASSRPARAANACTRTAWNAIRRERACCWRCEVPCRRARVRPGGGHPAGFGRDQGPKPIGP